jgi:hypothetical protein
VSILISYILLNALTLNINHKINIIHIIGNEKGPVPCNNDRGHSHTGLKEFNGPSRRRAYS